MPERKDNGFCIPFSIRETADKGRGVFTETSVSNGTRVWHHIKGAYEVFDEKGLKARLARMTSEQAVYELTHIFAVPEYPEYIINVNDGGEMINHSDQPNIAMNSVCNEAAFPCETSAQNVLQVTDALLNDRFSLVAIRDIEADEELTIDYNKGIKDPPYYDELYDHYGVSETYI